VTVAQADDVLRVPTNAVRTAGGQRTVQVKTATRIETRAIQVGIQGDQFVEVTSGLTVGEQVVITIQTTTTGGTNGGNLGPGGGNLVPGGGGFNRGGGGRGGGG
jgi:macrolide-specific efflux system membrane fusion protein